MRLSDYIITAQTNLTRSKLRTFLTILAILVGTFTLTLTTALGTGIQQFGEQQLRAEAQPDIVQIFPRQGNEGFNNMSATSVPEYNPDTATAKITRTTLSQSDLDYVKTLPNVISANFGRSVSPEYMQRDAGKKYVMSSLRTLYPMTKLDFAAGTMPATTDQSALIIPYHYLAPLGFATPEQAIGASLTIRFVQQQVNTGPSGNPAAVPKFEDLAFTIRAVLINSSVVQPAYLTAEAVNAISGFQFGDNQPPSVIVAGITPNLATADVTALRKALDTKGYDAFTYQDAIAQFTKVITIVQVSLGGFGGIALLAAMIGIVNTLLMAAFERTQEIGLWKALGMRRRGIFATFLYEALSIGFWGGMIGIGLAYGAGRLINQILSRTLLKNTEGFTLLVFRWEYMLGVVALAMIIGLIAGVLPAVRASRLDPIEALRHE